MVDCLDMKVMTELLNCMWQTAVVFSLNVTDQRMCHDVTVRTIECVQP